MGETWTVEWRDQSWTVCSFRERGTALRHCADHYLDDREAWHQVDGAAVRLVREHSSAPDEAKRGAVVEEACARYEAAIRRLTGKGRVDEARVRDYQGYRSLMVATDLGLFAGFGERSSDVRTAYRPIPPVVRRALSVQDFRDAARRKLARF